MKARLYKISPLGASLDLVFTSLTLGYHFECVVWNKHSTILFIFFKLVLLVGLKRIVSNLWFSVNYLQLNWTVFAASSRCCLNIKYDWFSQGIGFDSCSFCFCPSAALPEVEIFSTPQKHPWTSTRVYSPGLGSRCVRNNRKRAIYAATSTRESLWWKMYLSIDISFFILLIILLLFWSGW